MLSGFLDDKYASSGVEIKGRWEKIIFLDTGVLSNNSISPPPPQTQPTWHKLGIIMLLRPFSLMMQLLPSVGQATHHYA